MAVATVLAVAALASGCASIRLPAQSASNTATAPMPTNTTAAAPAPTVAGARAVPAGQPAAKPDAPAAATAPREAGADAKAAKTPAPAVTLPSTTTTDRPATPPLPAEKRSATAAKAAPPVAAAAKAPAVAAAVAKAAAPPLDLKSLETRLRETPAIGVMTKLTLKNQVDDLLDQFRAYYKGTLKSTLADLRRAYELLVMKVLALLQDADPPLATAIASSREAIWGILADPVKFSTV
jgi:cytoskeletal protein RodZ